MNEKRDLLIETLGSTEGGFLVEQQSAGKDLYLSGIFMQAEVYNRNKRLYPLQEMIGAVERASVLIEANNGIFGELDHPNTLSINSDRISHVITKLSMSGNNAIGKMKLIPTPCGMIAKTLIETGVRIGVSSRGTGMVNESGRVKDFDFVTCDIVITPSAPGATPTPVYESLDFNTEGRRVKTLAECLREDQSAQKYFKEAMLKFISELEIQGRVTKR